MSLIIDQIAEVKNYFSEHKKQYEDQIRKVNSSKGGVDVRGPAFVFGGQKPPDRAEILAAVPLRHVTDNLLSRYFNSCDPAARKCCTTQLMKLMAHGCLDILHSSTFYNQVSHFRPLSSPILPDSA